MVENSPVPMVGGLARGAYTLSEIPEHVVRLYCPQCHRWAQFRRSTLLRKYGPDLAMPDLLTLLRPCKINADTIGARCGLVYWDRMTSERRAEAIAKGGIPESWHHPR